MTAVPAPELSDLVREFKARGWHEKPTARILLQLAAHLGLILTGFALLLTFEYWLARAAGLTLLVYGTTGVATNTHTSSHYGTSRSRRLNEFLTWFGYPFFLGFSASYWRHSHIAVHHPSPNVVGVDDFVDVAPFFARTREEIARSRPLARFYYEHLQWMALLVLLAGQSLHLQVLGARHLLRRLTQPARRTRAAWFDLLGLVLHSAGFLVVPALLAGWHPTLALYALRGIGVGYLLFIILAPGHFPAGAACLTGHPGPGYFLEHIAATTVNYRTGPIGRLLCGGIEYHIEHHLFPGVSHVFYPAMSERVRAFFEARGLPYRSVSWTEGIRQSIGTFRRPPGIIPAAQLRGTPL